jgi:zinc protease
MLYLSFTDPRIDPVAVQAMMDGIATTLAHRNEDPNSVFSDEIDRTIYGGHPHFMTIEPADLPKADIDTALAFIRKGLNPADYTFVFTGNLDNAVMRNYIETYIASIPRGETWSEWKDLGITRPGKVERTVNKGKEEKSAVYMAWFVNTPFTDKLNVDAAVLNQYLNIKLTDEIREKLGGVYSISAGIGVSAIPRGEMSMAVSFGCDPQRVQELSTAVIDLLNQPARSIDRDTFGKAVEALKKGWETSMQSNSAIAVNYVLSVLLNLPLSRLSNRPGNYDAVTPADIQNICARLLPNGPARVVLYPETN